MDWVVDFPGVMTFEAINEKLGALEARQMIPNCGQPIDVQLQAAIRRMGCPLYWRRQLRRAQVQKREAQEQAAGHVWAQAMPYCHDVTLSRHIERQKANQQMLEFTEIESADGEVISLKTAADASTANKSIRRGELMARIRGCEEWATERGMVGIFTTNTAPSRFHASLFAGGKNPKFDGSTPRIAQQWLSRTWARARAKIKRQGLKVFGFRVAEPHHDGCPHWHMMLWTYPEQLHQLQNLLRSAWLQEELQAAKAARARYTCKPSGFNGRGQSLFGRLNLNAIEYGAEEYRFKSERIDPARGGAIAYVAKYVAKNIDDAGSLESEGHDDYEGDKRQSLKNASAQRVTAWASAWGIRQFQAIGQPPVTVWRELRRVNPGDVAASSKRMQRAYAAVHKTAGKRANWAEYMTEQGGPMVGRGYQLRLDFNEEAKEGRYGQTVVKTPQAVWDVSRPGEFCNSQRRKWKAKGTWTPAERHTAKVGLLREVWNMDLNEFKPKRAHTPEQQERARAAHEGEFAICAPWTRLNNCTQAAPEKRVSRVNSWQILAGNWPRPEPRRTRGESTERKAP
jgi:hypothetical protein